MKIKRVKGDMVIPIVVAAVAIFGVVAVYSASRYICEEDYGNGFYFALKQLVGFFGGLIAMFLTMQFDYKKYFKAAKWLYLCGLLLLACLYGVQCSKNVSCVSVSWRISWCHPDFPVTH